MKYIAIIAIQLLATLSASAHGISDADKQGILEGSNFEYLKLGASHMLTGYDHLLFLFGVIFFLTKFRDIVKFITAFTLGPCTTVVIGGILSSTFLTLVLLPVLYAWLEKKTTRTAVPAQVSERKIEPALSWG